MPFANTPQAHAALSADGDALGYVTVADATKFYPGANVWLYAAALGSKEYVITDIAGNKIGLREVLERYGGAQYGRTPVTQWTTAGGATISQAPQTVDVELSNLAKLDRI